MNKRYFTLAMIVAILGVLLAGCGPAPATSRPQDTTGGPLHVTVSILPQKYFLERIGGERVIVNVMTPPGASPHTYEPKPDQLVALSQAVAYFSIGVEFERAWLSRITAANNKMLMVDTAQGIERIPMVAHHDEHTEALTPAAGDAHQEGDNLDPHIWTSPELAKVQARTIYAALAQIDPTHQAAYQANLDRFIADIDRLETEIRATLSGAQNRKFMVFHPSWGYFARDFGLEQIPIEVGGQEPSAAELAALISEARANGIQVIFAQPEFSTRAAETIAREIGGQVLLIDPLAADWLGNLRQVADAFAGVLGK
ncbi:MAG: cation ABC transporter substrate-binding protein [Chloroflexi bacterium HGW-Chloroflexi-1]|nr:MAG: cation ABC transporter substrate-binding protein [Chloroflexi bacterium HGW-Chloroflexi-1]